MLETMRLHGDPQSKGHQEIWEWESQTQEDISPVPWEMVMVWPPTLSD